MTKKINDLIQDALDDLKAKDVTVLDVAELSDVMDHLIIATGSSNRHVKSLAENVISESKEAGHRPIGVEGMDGGEWVLVDYGDTVLHVMQQSSRDFYELEKLWSMKPEGRKNNPESE